MGAVVGSGATVGIAVGTTVGVSSGNTGGRVAVGSGPCAQATGEPALEKLVASTQSITALIKTPWSFSSVGISELLVGRSADAPVTA